MARKPTPMEIRAAYALLGIEPGVAGVKDARRAYRRLSKEVHPDHHPDDPSAAQNFQRLTHALDLVVEHIRSGGVLPDVGADDTLTKTGPVHAIWEVRAPAGAGKTTRWAAALAARMAGEAVVRRSDLAWPPGRPLHMIYAGPTIALLQEVGRELAKHHVPHELVHSESGPGLPVRYKLAKYFAETRPSADAVLLITHTALLDLPVRLIKRKRRPDEPDQVVFNRQEWDLVVDETPDVLKFYPEAWPLSHRTISERVIAVEFSRDLYQLTPASDAARKFLQMLAGDIPHDTNISEGTREIAHHLTNPYRKVLVHKNQWDDLAYRKASGQGLNPYTEMVYGGALDVMVIVLPRTFAEYRSATIMGARLESSLYHVLWRKLFNMRYRKHPLQETLPSLHANGKRLRLWYFVNEPATRELLMRKSEDGSTMFDAMTARVAKFFEPPSKRAKSEKGAVRFRQFIWSAPLDRGSTYGVRDNFFQRSRVVGPRTGARPFDPDLRLSGRAMGQNKWLAYNNAVLLSVVNFSPSQYVMLHSLGLTDNELYRALAHNIAYQDLLRCSIRSAGGGRKAALVNGIVVDRATALDIGKDFPGCTMRQMPDAPQLRKRRKPGPAAKGNAVDNAERQRRWRQRQRDARERLKDKDSS